MSDLIVFIDEDTLTAEELENIYNDDFEGGRKRK